jgi:hypothetical protein
VLKEMDEQSRSAEKVITALQVALAVAAAFAVKAFLGL